jgi:glyoxylase-like metal-dependent hydrolase (beta-lactamase superfamily II)
MKITEQIHAIKIPFQIPVAPGETFDRFVYSYLIYGDEICLIDSGVASSDSVIFDYIRKSDRNPEEISLMILTHAHPDHIGSAKAIKEATNCTVAAHEYEKPWIEDVDLQFQVRPIPGFHSLVGGSVQTDLLLREGETIDLGNLSLEVFHTPGHSKGSISLFCKESGVLFSGDAIPQWNELPIYDDVTVLVKSINKLRSINGIKFLLASWNDPKKNKEAYKMIDDGLDYLQGIHNAILQIHDENILQNPMELCKQMVHNLGLPAIAINPLVAKSFASHLKILDQKNLGNG